MPLARVVIAVFESFEVHQEPLAALQLVRHALGTDELKAEVLCEMREQLRQIPWI